MKRKIWKERVWLAGLLLLAVIFCGAGCVSDGTASNDDQPANTNIQAQPGQFPHPKLGHVTPVDDD